MFFIFKKAAELAAFLFELLFTADPPGPETNFILYL
jgi:hypothetical protein